MANTTKSSPHHAEPHFEEPHPAAHPEAHETVAPPKPEPPVKTIADEQRERSAEMEKVGVNVWVEAHDERSAEEKAAAGKTPVPGVGTHGKAV